MFNENLSSANDNRPQLSNKEVEKRRKDRAQRLREKFGIESRLSDDQLLGQENKITQAQEQAVQDTENQFIQEEGNVAEKLLQAADQGGDGDIATALNMAQQYHQTSSQRAKQVLSQKIFNYVGSVFHS